MLSVSQLCPCQCVNHADTCWVVNARARSIWHHARLTISIPEQFIYISRWCLVRFMFDMFFIRNVLFLLNVVKTLESRKFPSISVVGLRVSPIPLAAVIVSLNTSGSGEGSPIPLVVVMVSLNTSGSGEGSPIPKVTMMVSLDTRSFIV